MIVSRIFFSLTMLANLLLVLLGGYGYFWRSRFLNGDAAGPYWLLQLYDRWAPLLFYAAVIAFLLFFILRLIGGIFRMGEGDGTARLSLALRLAVLLGAIAVIPACQGEFTPLQTIDFGGEQYHLVQQQQSSGVTYGVFHCGDPGSFFCDVAGETTPWAVLFPNPPATPTPLPPMTTIVEDELILLNPRAPTATPPAELVIQPLLIDGRQEEQLSLKIGDAWLGIEISTPTP